MLLIFLFPGNILVMPSVPRFFLVFLKFFFIIFLLLNNREFLLSVQTYTAEYDRIEFRFAYTNAKRTHGNVNVLIFD